MNEITVSNPSFSHTWSCHQRVRGRRTSAICRQGRELLLCVAAEVEIYRQRGGTWRLCKHRAGLFRPHLCLDWLWQWCPWSFSSLGHPSASFKFHSSQSISHEANDKKNYPTILWLEDVCFTFSWMSLSVSNCKGAPSSERRRWLDFTGLVRVGLTYPFKSMTYAGLPSYSPYFDERTRVGIGPLTWYP